MIMNTYPNKPERIRLSWMNIFWFVLGLLLMTGEVYSQTYQISMNQRRMGNKIGVEFWAKDISTDASASKLGNVTLTVTYNRDFLVPDGNVAYASTDSVQYDMDIDQPYVDIVSPYSLSANGYSALTAQPANDGTTYYHSMDINKAMSGIGIQPASTGRGTFLGMVKFTITNYSILTDTTKSIIKFNTAGTAGNIIVEDYNGNTVKAQTSFVDPSAFNIRGIRIINPNGGQAVNRFPDPALKSLTPNKGYPIYFERSGLGGVVSGTAGYGTGKYAYSVDYSLDGGSSWIESGRIAETNLNATTMGSNKDIYRGGEIDSLNATNNFFIAQGDGSVLPALTGDGYEGVIRLIWKANENFFARSEQAKLKVVQLDTATSANNISTRTKYTANGRYDISDATFVLGRLFFVQLDGQCGYFKTQNPFSTPSQLTVESWVNLNGIQATAGAEPAIVASADGTLSTSHGSWMLYLKDGKYPAFRAYENSNNGANILADIWSSEALNVSDATAPVNNAHAGNWVHIAASVKDNLVTLYVNGEIVNQFTNLSSVSPRLWATTHPLWIGVNPNGGIDASKYLYAGIKEVKIWRTALDQNIIRSRMSGVYDANGTITALGSSSTSLDNRTTLELYYPLQGARLDIADEYFYQKNANPINWNVCGGTVNNNAINYRPDRSHIKLTAPLGGEGVSNLKGNTLKVRWAAYGLGKNSAGTSDIQIMISRDKGATWFDAIDNQTPAYPLDRVEVESYEAEWAPYNNITTSGQDDDLQGVVDLDNNYSKSVKLRISGTEARNQNDIYAESGEFKVAPYFAIKNSGNAKIQVKDKTTSLNLNGGIGMIEAWIRPYKFPTVAEEYFPIVCKKLDDGSNNLQYALRLLPTGQLELAIGSSTGATVRTARSAATSPIIPPTLQVSDSAWYHVAAYVNLANGGTATSVRFYIDGTPQYVDSITTQLGTTITVDPENAYPVFFGYEPSTTAGQGKYFIGDMREVRFWGGNPGNQQPSNVEPSALTKFVQGAAQIRASELGSFGGVDYSANLLAAFSFNGGNYVPSGYVNTIQGFPTANNFLAHISGTGFSYTATRPTIKLVEPKLAQKVPNTLTDLRVRWTGFDFNRNNITTFRSGSDGSNHADLQYSIKGGGGVTIQDWQQVASQKWSAGYSNSMTLPKTNNTFEFLGTTNKAQYAAQLDVSKADPDMNNDFSYNDQGPLGAAKTNGRLLLNGRSTINGLVLEYDNLSYGLMPSLQTMTDYFNITPPSNFTVRVMLEGHHVNSKMANDVGSTYADGGYKITLYKNNSGIPGAGVDSAESEYGYVSHATAMDPTVAPVRGIDGSQYANVPFVFTELADGRYFVKVDQINHLPILSRFAAPFTYDGDDNATWAVESGWDFQGWNPTANAGAITETEAGNTPPSIANKYTAYGNYETNPNLSDYSATGLVYNSGQLGVTTGSNLLAAMVGGDVVKDGEINGKDRSLVVLYDGGSNINADVTGDGMVNATDRFIVYRNSGKISSLPKNSPVSAKISTPLMNDLYTYAPELLERNNKIDDELKANGKFVANNTPMVTKNDAIQAGLSYRVNATPKLEGEFLTVPMYITNTGSEFGLGNATFGIKYNPAQMQFVSMEQNSTVIFDKRDDLGYDAAFTAPFVGTKDPITDLRTIDIDYNIYDKINHRPGMNVPFTSTYLGTLKFKVSNLNEGIFLTWHPITVVYSTDGLDITGQGTFETIPAIVVNKVATVTYPNGAEKFEAGSLYTIAWTAPSQKAFFNLDYSTDNAHTWNRINTSPVMSADMNYNWVTPKIKTTEALVRIINAEDGVEIDRSDAPFSINPTTADITRPCTADPVYVGGTNDQIKWSFDNSANVRFEFSATGNDWTTVTALVNASDNKVNWTLPVVNAKAALVRMVDAKTNEILATSSPFKILAGSVDITSPNSKKIVSTNTKENITWTYKNVNKFDLQFSDNNGTSWITIATDVTPMADKFTWSVPNLKSNKAIIRAIWNGDESMEYDRTEVFVIDGIVSVEKGDDLVSFVTAPNPFYTDMKVNFNIPSDMNVNIVLYNALGDKVRTVISGEQFSAGDHTLSINGEDLPSGSYYLHINAGMTTMTKEIIKVK